MSNVTGIAIVVKAFLPTGKTLDEQFAALSIVKTAHETGDYAPLLAAAQIDEVKTEQKTRRMDDAPKAEPLADDAPDFAEVDEDSSDAEQTLADIDGPLDMELPDTETPKRRTRAA